MTVSLRGHTLTASLTLAVEECCNCGITFAMPDDHMAILRRATGRTFYCPNGHGQSYRGESFDAQVRRLETTITHLRDQSAATERSLTATKGALTKAREKVGRIAKGVCPFCHRHFANVERHMAGQHPAKQGKA